VRALRREAAAGEQNEQQGDGAAAHAGASSGGK
jgi:hypothetical protein